jgi:hypothetical protein
MPSRNPAALLAIVTLPSLPCCEQTPEGFLPPGRLSPTDAAALELRSDEFLAFATGGTRLAGPLPAIAHQGHARDPEIARS